MLTHPETMMRPGYYPEPPIEPPEEHYVTAGCGCEVYEGEHLFCWEGKTHCPDCFEGKIREMSLEELALLLGSDYEEVAP